MTATLPIDFRPVAFDPRRALPLAASVSVTAGTYRLLIVATPADLAGVLAMEIDQPWFGTDRDENQFAVPTANFAGALGQASPDAIRATRPTLVVASTNGVHWARPMTVGMVQRVVDETGRGLLFELLVVRAELRVASLVRAADVGSELTVGVHDPLARTTAVAAASISEEDPYVALF